LPDPEDDTIAALFYCLHGEDEDVGNGNDTEVGVISVATTDFSAQRLGFEHFVCDEVSDELELINLFIDKLHSWDPEVLAGYEVQNSSWGYLLRRGQIYGQCYLDRRGRYCLDWTNFIYNKTDARSRPCG
jgi:DNA polymerase zeta